VIKKIISPHHFPDEPTVTLWEPGLSLVKTAYSTNEELQAALRALTRDSKSGYVLTNALGAHESFGANNNGDSFETKELLPSNYKSFETAHVYSQHANKDVSKARGKVLKSLWNPVMMRVELLLELPVDKNSDVLSKAERGDDVGVSMGCKVKADECSWCGNMAPTRRQYCDHILHQLLHIREDGKVACMLNKHPQFFDLSLVSIGADKTAYFLEKVAGDPSYSAGGRFVHQVYGRAVFAGIPPWRAEAMLEKCAGLPESVQMADIVDQIEASEKQAKIRKVSDIDKVVESGPILGKPSLEEILQRFRREHLSPMRRAEAEIPSVALDEMSDAFKGDAGGLLATLAAYGVVLKPREYQRLILGNHPLREKLDGSDATFETMEPKFHPEDGIEFEPGQINHGIASNLQETIASKSQHRGALLERVMNGAPHAEEREPIALDDETEHDHGQLLSRMGGAFEHYTGKATEFARRVADLAADCFPDTELTIRLGIAPVLGHDAGAGLPALALGASSKEAMARYPEALRGTSAQDLLALKKVAARHEGAGQFIRAPEAVIDMAILSKVGLL